jgi:PII-like signaling protein
MEEMESQSLRIYCVASDHSGHTRLHEAIVDSARRAGLAGASVQKAKMGFSQGGHYYSALLSEVEIEQQPLVVEIIGSPQRIENFVPTLHELVRGRRLITWETVEVLHYQVEVNNE